MNTNQLHYINKFFGIYWTKSRHLIFIILDQERESEGKKYVSCFFILMFVINLERAEKKRDVGHE